RVGPRQARLTTTVGDLVEAGGTQARKKLDTAARDRGLRTDDILQEPVGGLVGVGVPFMDPMFVLGTGQRAQRVASGMDRAGAAVRYANVPGTNFQPVNA